MPHTLETVLTNLIQATGSHLGELGLSALPPVLSYDQPDLEAAELNGLDLVGAIVTAAHFGSQHIDTDQDGNITFKNLLSLQIVTSRKKNMTGRSARELALSLLRALTQPDPLGLPAAFSHDPDALEAAPPEGYDRVSYFVNLTAISIN